MAKPHEAERIASPNYCTYEKVCQDMKSMNKGGYWSGTIGNIKRAKLEIADGMNEALMNGSLVARTQK
eukprot:6518898-Prorocentrum_lima.AAC.1